MVTPLVQDLTGKGSTNWHTVRRGKRTWRDIKRNEVGETMLMEFQVDSERML
jgi:hypothetical protein